MKSSAKESGPNSCTICGRTIGDEAQREWITRGTGVCSHCARARIAHDESTTAGKRYLDGWYGKIDTLAEVAVTIVGRGKAPPSALYD